MEGPVRTVKWVGALSFPDGSLGSVAFSKVTTPLANPGRKASRYFAVGSICANGRSWGGRCADECSSPSGNALLQIIAGVGTNGPVLVRTRVTDSRRLSKNHALDCLSPYMFVDPRTIVASRVAELPPSTDGLRPQRRGHNRVPVKTD